MPNKTRSDISRSDKVAQTHHRVAVGVASLVVQSQQILLGKRFNSQGEFVGWQCPGGFMRRGETLQQAVQRCCLEKCGLWLAHLQPGPYTNNLFTEETAGVDGAEVEYGVSAHTVTLYMYAHQFQIRHQNRYTDPQYAWQWFNLEAMPSELYLPLQRLCDEHELMRLISRED